MEVYNTRLHMSAEEREALAGELREMAAGAARSEALALGLIAEALIAFILIQLFGFTVGIFASTASLIVIGIAGLFVGPRLYNRLVEREAGSMLYYDHSLKERITPRDVAMAYAVVSSSPRGNALLRELDEPFRREVQLLRR